MRRAPDSVDLRELRQALRRGWYLPLAGAAVGALLAIIILLLVSPKYEATASVLLKNLSAFEVSSGSGLAPNSSAPGGLADVLSLDPGFDTEVAILTSRSVVGEVVRDLGLQVELTAPGEASITTLLSDLQLEDEVLEGTYEISVSGGTLDVSGPGTSIRVAPGDPIQLPGAVLRLDPDHLPEKFTLELFDFDEAVERVRESIAVSRAGGSLAEVRYRSKDRLRTPEVPNALVDAYLARRRTTDRGISQRRYEFLQEQADSLTVELSEASRRLREHQQRSGLISPDARAEAEVLQAMELRARSQELAVEARSLELSLGRPGEPPRNARDVASYPVLLSNPAVNQMLERLSDLEAERALLLERRYEEDPDVLVLTREIERAEAEIHQIARAYQAAIGEQLAEVRSELSSMTVNLESLPVQVEESFHLQREVQRLSGVLTGVQGDLLRTRMAAIAEGGDVRQIDRASVPREPVFPVAPLLLALGILGGGFFGAVGVLVQPAFGRTIRSTAQLERMLGVPALTTGDRSPLLIRALDEHPPVLVLPVSATADSLAASRALARTAALRGRNVVVMAMTGDATKDAPLLPGEKSGAGTEAHNALRPVGSPEGGSYVVWTANGGGPAAARSAVGELAGGTTLVIIALPVISDPVTAGLLHPERPVVLVVREGHSNRDDVLATAAHVDQIGCRIETVLLQGKGHASPA